MGCWGLALKYLIILIALLQLADSFLTVQILKRGGKELNPFMDWLFSKIGVIPALVIVKLAFVGGLVVIMPYAPVAAYIVIALAYAGIVIHNVIEFRKICA